MNESNGGNFWRAIDTVYFQQDLPVQWQRRMGADYAAARGGFLQRTGKDATCYPSPALCRCSLRVVKHAPEDIVGVSDCGFTECEDVVLQPADIEVWGLNFEKLGRAVAGTLGCEVREADLGLPLTRQIGVFAGAVPVVLTIRPGPQGFNGVLAQLVATLKERFIVLSPTTQCYDGRVQALLKGNKAGFFDLETNLILTPDGGLQARRTGAELFAECVPQCAPRCVHPPMGDEAGSVECNPAAKCLIRLEGARRRAGKHDRTEALTWRIRFHGAEVLMPAWVGTEYLIHLMRHQGSRYDADEFHGAVRKHRAGGPGASAGEVNEILRGGGSGEGGSNTLQGRIGDVNERDVAWDGSQIQGARRRIQALEAEIREHEAAGDSGSEAYLVLKEKLEEQEDLLRANAKQVQGKWVAKEYQKGTFKEKADVIRKHIRNVLDGYLRQNCRPLYDHLNDKAVLRYGVENWYRPTPRVEWEVEVRNMKKGR